MEMMGLEPTTFCLQSRCSSQLSYIPDYRCPSYGAVTSYAVITRFSTLSPCRMPLSAIFRGLSPANLRH